MKPRGTPRKGQGAAQEQVGERALLVTRKGLSLFTPEKNHPHDKDPRPAVRGHSAPVADKEYVVLYRYASVMNDLEPPHGYLCRATGAGQARALCHKAFPSCEVVSVHRGQSYQAALSQYWGMADDTETCAVLSVN